MFFIMKAFIIIINLIVMVVEAINELFLDD